MAAGKTGGALASSGVLGQVYTDGSINALGQLMEGQDSLGNFAEYVWLKGVASTIVGSVVTFDEVGVTTLIAAGGFGPVAVALAICDATTKFAWYGRTGTFPTDVVANTADNAKLGRETTNGKVGDAPATGDQAVGMISRAATTAAAIVNVQYDRAWVPGGLGA